jgi:hypothetical protein
VSVIGFIAGFARRTRRLGAASAVKAVATIRQTNPLIVNAKVRVLVICKLLLFDDCIAAANNHKKAFVYACR